MTRKSKQTAVFKGRYKWGVLSLIACILLIVAAVGFSLWLRHQRQNWRKIVENGMDKDYLELILPPRVDESDGPSTSATTFWTYYLEDGTILHCRFSNPGSWATVIGDFRREHGLVDWTLADHKIQEPSFR